MNVVVDASVIANLLLLVELPAPVFEVLADRDNNLHIPAFCDVEIASTLREGIRRKEISESRALEAIIDYLELPLHRHSHEAFLVRIMGLRENFSPYDATYVALAEALEATLLTADRGLARAVRSHLKIPVVTEQ